MKTAIIFLARHLVISVLLYPPKIGRISDVVRSGRGSEFVA